MKNNLPPAPTAAIQQALTRVVDSIESLRFIEQCLTDRQAAGFINELAEDRQECVEDLAWLLSGEGVEACRRTSPGFAVHRAWMGFIHQLLRLSDARTILVFEQQERALAGTLLDLGEQVDSRGAKIIAGIAKRLRSDAEILHRISEILGEGRGLPAPRGMEGGVKTVTAARGLSSAA